MSFTVCVVVLCAAHAHSSDAASPQEPPASVPARKRSGAERAGRDRQKQTDRDDPASSGSTGDAGDGDASGADDDVSDPNAGTDGADDGFDFGDGDDGDGDDGDGGGNDGFDFGDKEVGDTAAPAVLPYSAGGFLRSEWGASAERLTETPFAKGRQAIDLWFRYRKSWLRLLFAGHAEYDVAYRADRDEYDEPTLEAYEWLVDGREILASASLGDFELTLGRQIVPWGEGTLITPVDRVNPRDLREPGLTDVDDLRLPILATRASYFRGQHRVEAMLIHEAFFGYRPAPLSLFSTLPALLPPSLGDRVIRYRDRQERFAIDNQQIAARWVYKGHGLDVAVQAAWLLDATGVFLLPAAEQLLQPEFDIELDHRRYVLLGHSGAWPRGSWVLRWEIAAEFDRAMDVEIDPAADPSMSPFGVARGSLVTPMVSATYSGVADLLVMVELSKSFFIDRPGSPLYPFEAAVMALRADYTRLRGDLQLTAVAYLVGADLAHGWLLRAEASYVLTEGVKIGGGYVTYQPGDEFGPIAGFDTHDRLFARLRWDFHLL